MPSLLLVDVAATQGYVFGSNLLREAAGASHLVDAVSRTWLREALPAPHNLDPARDWAADPFRDGWVGAEASEAVAAEVVVAGGGGAVVRFPDDADGTTAGEVARRLAARVFVEAPGLGVRYRVHPYVGGFAPALRAARREMAVQKGAAPASAFAMPEPSVTAECRSTGRAASVLASGLVPPRQDGEVPRYPNGFPASLESLAKLRASWKSEESVVFRRLTTLVPVPSGWTYALDAEDVTGDDERRRLAVVHADVDGLGHALQGLGEGLDDGAAVRRVRDVSVALSSVTAEALRQTVGRLAEALEAAEARGGAGPARKAGGVALPSPVTSGAVRVLPFRPIVSGGDDVTFLADGRVGVALAAEFCRRFSDLAGRDDALGALGLTASAGVALVGVKSPFSRAYTLADALCRSAKAYRREVAQAFGPAVGPCLDWLDATGGTEAALADARRPSVQSNARGAAVAFDLTALPVTVGPHPDVEAGARSWVHVAAAARAFQEASEWTRSRQQRLAAAHLRGPEGVEDVLQDLVLSLPSTPVHRGPGAAYVRGRTPAYLDALGLADRAAFFPSSDSGPDS